MPPLKWDDANSSGEWDPNSTRMRNPQKCTICGKLYNNYYNVLRHMESKHPDKMPGTYRCQHCPFAYPRQCELREHSFKVHGIPMPKITRDVYVCRICNAVFDLKEVFLDHQGETHSKYYCHLCDMETISMEEMEGHLADHTNSAEIVVRGGNATAVVAAAVVQTKQHKCTLCQHSFNTERGLETHLAVMHYIKKDQMPRASRESIQSSEASGTEALEVSVDVHINGDDDDDDDGGADDDDVNHNHHDNNNDNNEDENNHQSSFNRSHAVGGSEADLDETIEHQQVKRIKLEVPPPPLAPLARPVMPAAVFLPSKMPTGRARTSTPRSTSIVGAYSIRKCPMCHETFSGGIALANHLRTHGIPSMRQFMPKIERPILPRPPREQKPPRQPRPPAGERPINDSGRATVSSRMRCRICQKRIHTKASYKRHMLNMHGVSDCIFMRCRLCPSEFSNDKGFKVHMFRTHDVSVQEMEQDERLRPIQKTESTSAAVVVAGPSNPRGAGTVKNILPKAPTVFECDICHTVYRSTEQLKSHRRTVHGVAER